MSDSLRRFKADIFQALAHPTRIAIVEALREGELPAGQLIEKLQLEQANASQHLSVLRSKSVVVNRKAGNQVFYSLRDPVLIDTAGRIHTRVNLMNELDKIRRVASREGTKPFASFSKRWRSRARPARC